MIDVLLGSQPKNAWHAANNCAVCSLTLRPMPLSSSSVSKSATISMPRRVPL